MNVTEFTLCEVGILLLGFKENREQISLVLPTISTVTVTLEAKSARLKQTKTSCERFTQLISSPAERQRWLFIKYLSAFAMFHFMSRNPLLSRSTRKYLHIILDT